MPKRSQIIKRRITALACLVGGIVGLVSAVPAIGASESTGTVCGVSNGYGDFSSDKQPGACWRPYSSSSPFNRAIPAGAPSVPSSASIVKELLSGGPVNDLVVGDPARDGGNPVFWSEPGDPVYRLHCVMDWGHCEVEGDQVRVSAQAKPSGGFSTKANEHDAHMTIVDQDSGVEYDLWNVRSKANGVIAFGWGGKTDIDGDGLGSDGVAARYGNLAGIVRLDELKSGTINHALVMDVPCTQTYVYPAVQTGYECTEAGLPVGGSAAMGAHFQLKMSNSEIDALRVAPWKKTILRALAKYGAYTSDTTGAADQWGFEVESSATYTSFGKSDPWVQFARKLGYQAEDFNNNGAAEYWMDLDSGVPWGRMRVVNVCAARGTCPVTATVSQDPTKLSRAARCWSALNGWRNDRSERSNGVDQELVLQRVTRCRVIARSIASPSAVS